MAVELLSAMAGTAAFSVLFGVPRKHTLACGLIGGAGWAVYLWLAGLGGRTEAYFGASVAVILLSRFLAVRRQCPATLFFIPGLFPLIPGVGVCWTAYYVVTDQLSLAVGTGYEAAKCVVAIVLGIVFTFELPQRFFFVGRKGRRGL